MAFHIRAWSQECVHVLECGLSESNDLEIWSHASANDQVVISKDEDFVFLANRSGGRGRLIWVRVRNCRNPFLMAAFDRAKDGILQALASGQRIVELR